MMLLVLASVATLSGADPSVSLDGSSWPHFNGAAGDRTTTGPLAVRAFPESGPHVVWRERTQAGFSSFVIGDGRAYTLEARAVGGETREVCVARDADDGAELWATPVGTTGYDGGGGAGASDNKGGDGPRGTPTLDGALVYVYDAHLGLTALEAESGAVRWNQDVLADFDGKNIRWQNATSPLVEGDLVIVAGGGAGQSLLAFDKADGALRWKTGSETLTHATPVAAEIAGRRTVLFLMQSGLVAVEPSDGSELWRQAFDWRTSTAASPVVYEDVVYVSAGYGVGAAAFVVEAGDDDGFTVTNLWRKRNDLMNHWSTPLAKDGYLYGMFSFKKYGEGPLQCVELATGEVQWSMDGFGPGNCILVGDTLVALGDAGQLVLVDADPAAYRERARADVLRGKCWSSPAYSDGQVYVRSTEEGVRIDLSGAR